MAAKTPSKSTIDKAYDALLMVSMATPLGLDGSVISAQTLAEVREALQLLQTDVPQLKKR